MPDVHLHVLGPLRVRTDRGDVVALPARERTLLAMLLLHANRTVFVDQLVDGIWDTARAPRDARGQLQACVYRLRKRLGDAGFSDELIATDPGGYRATVEPAELDLLEFRRLVAEARAARAGRPAEAIDRYQAALRLWHGPALAGIHSELVRRVVQVVEEERLQVLEERVEAQLASGTAGELIAELTDLVRQHPYREGLHGALMLALYRAGRAAEALATYRQVHQSLHDELGTEPGTELQDLHRAILRRDAALDAPNVPSELRRPAGLPVPTPRELPAEVAGFTGRAEALKTLDEMVTVGADGTLDPVVISAIAGSAGVGKTALAVHWAHRVADQFPDGQLYINLRGYAAGPPLRPIDALAALLRSLGTPPAQIPVDEAQAGALYRTQLAGRRALVVLDNARAASQVRPLLPGSPGCLVLVTSRDRLAGLVARDGARRITLPVLTPAESRTLLARLLGPERTRAEPDATSGLAGACAHLPLALRIAAAHLADRPDRSIASYVSELTTSDRLASLRADGDDETAVRAALGLSYQAIPDPARRLFRLLGLVPGPDFTPAAAAALAGATADDPTHLLRQLAGAHLIDEPEPGRYTFHDLLRLYARQLAQHEDTAGDRAEATGRLLDFYLHTAHRAATTTHPGILRLPVPPAPASPATTFDSPAHATIWLAAERANLVAAVQHAAEHGPHAPAWLITDCLRGYLWQTRHTADWEVVATAALRAADHEANPAAQAAAHLSLGDLSVATATYPEAIEQFGAALELARRAGWADAEPTFAGKLGIAYWQRGELENAAHHFQESVALCRLTTRAQERAAALTHLGSVYRELGRLEQAATHLNQSLALLRELGPNEGMALNNVGVVYHELGDLRRAADHLEQALELSRQIGARHNEANALDSLAGTRRDAGRASDALDLAQAAVELASEIGDRRTEVDAINTLGSVQLSLGRADDALRRHRQALEMAREIGTHIAVIVALLGHAAAHQRLGHRADAFDHAESALAQARGSGHRVLEGQALTLLADIRLGQSRPGEARDLAERALANHRRTGHRLGEARTLVILGRIAHNTGGAKAAEAHWHAAHDLFVEGGAAIPDDLADVVGR
jgi:DNA-binding SARP family transcriptional activator/Tfp pilus assembly protein PilF